MSAPDRRVESGTATEHSRATATVAATAPAIATGTATATATETEIARESGSVSLTRGMTDGARARLLPAIAWRGAPSERRRPSCRAAALTDRDRALRPAVAPTDTRDIGEPLPTEIRACRRPWSRARRRSERRPAQPRPEFAPPFRLERRLPSPRRCRGPRLSATRRDLVRTTLTLPMPSHRPAALRPCEFRQPALRPTAAPTPRCRRPGPRPRGTPRHPAPCRTGPRRRALPTRPRALAPTPRQPGAATPRVAGAAAGASRHPDRRAACRSRRRPAARPPSLPDPVAAREAPRTLPRPAKYVRSARMAVPMLTTAVDSGSPWRRASWRRSRPSCRAASSRRR